MKETRSRGAKVEFILSPSLKKRLQRKAAKANTSVSQIMRDLTQRFVKE